MRTDVPQGRGWKPEPHGPYTPPVLRPLILALLAVGCGSRSGPATGVAPPTAAGAVPTRARPSEPVARDTVSTCRLLLPESEEQISFDAEGLPTARYEASDAAGTQYEERYLRDERGRVVRIQREAVEGMGEEGPLLETRVTYAEDEDSRQVEARYDDPEEGVRIVRWTYDERGRPVSIEDGFEDRQPRVRTCRYDDHGRVATSDERLFTYASDADSFPNAVSNPWDPQQLLQVLRLPDGVWVSDPDPPAYVDRAPGRYLGECLSRLLEPCSSVFAPPPPGGRRAPRQRAPAFTPLPSPEAVGREALRCREGDVDSEDACTLTVPYRLEAPAGGALREVAVLKLERGPQQMESHHLAIATEAGWWQGPKIADGPFNGNQMSGTMHFHTRDPALRELVGGGDPELLLHYETERAYDDEEDVDHELQEEGYLVCRDLATVALRCVRIAEHVRDVIEGGARTIEARAQLSFPGDGTVHVENARGEHEDVPRSDSDLDVFFEP